MDNEFGEKHRGMDERKSNVTKEKIGGLKRREGGAITNGARRREVWSVSKKRVQKKIPSSVDVIAALRSVTIHVMEGILSVNDTTGISVSNNINELLIYVLERHLRTLLLTVPEPYSGEKGKKEEETGREKRSKIKQKSF